NTDTPTGASEAAIGAVHAAPRLADFVTKIRGSPVAVVRPAYVMKMSPELRATAAVTRNVPLRATGANQGKTVGPITGGAAGNVRAPSSERLHSMRNVRALPDVNVSAVMYAMSSEPSGRKIGCVA